MASMNALPTVNDTDGDEPWWRRRVQEPGWTAREAPLPRMPTVGKTQACCCCWRPDIYNTIKNNNNSPAGGGPGGDLHGM